MDVKKTSLYSIFFLIANIKATTNIEPCNCMKLYGIGPNIAIKIRFDKAIKPRL